MAKLTKRQNEILKLIQAHIQSTGSPPTRAEIAKTMGFKSPNASEDHLRALARKGAIELIPGTSRGIRLHKPLGIPIINTALKPGLPLLSDDNIQTITRLDKSLFDPSVDFIVRIPNNHLSQHGILTGDYLAVHQSKNLSNGQMGVFRIHNELRVSPYSDEIKSQNPTIEGVITGVIRPLIMKKLL